MHGETLKHKKSKGTIWQIVLVIFVILFCLARVWNKSMPYKHHRAKSIVNVSNPRACPFKASIVW